LSAFIIKVCYDSSSQEGFVTLKYLKSYEVTGRARKKKKKINRYSKDYISSNVIQSQIFLIQEIFLIQGLTYYLRCNLF